MSARYHYYVQERVFLYWDRLLQQYKYTKDMGHGCFDALWLLLRLDGK
jgi:hypothetical protein